jgi:hypothetical protein
MGRHTPLCVSRALLALCCVLATTAIPGAHSGQRGRGGWDPTLLQQWVAALETHVPGSIDAPLASAAGWSGDDLLHLWADVHVLLQIVVAPRTTRFDTPPLSFESGPRARNRPSVTFKKEEREELDALASRVRARGLNAVAHRAAVLHTDVVTEAGSIAAPSGAALGPSTRWFIGDGTGLSAAGQSLHWELARSVLNFVQPDPRRDSFVRDWYRATVATAQAVEFFDNLHLARGLRLFPDDPELLLLAGAEREAMATPLFQAFARSVRRGALVAGIDSASAELAAAVSYYRRTLAADPDHVEARIRMGRVLGLRGRHADAVEELRRATAAPLDRAYQYLVLLFLGEGLEGVGDAAAALAAFEQAVALVPEARAPYLAIARLSRERGDRARTLSSLDRALAPMTLDDPIDPLWLYRGMAGRRRMSLLDDIRTRAGADRP